MSEKLGPPPVEKLSDVEWARLERGLWAKLDNAPPASAPEPDEPRRRWWLLAIPAVAAAAIAIVVTRPSAPTPEKGVETADVRIVAPGSASTTATFDDAHIELAPAAAVVMRRDKPITVLERGAAWFSVAPRIDRPAFTVVAGDTTVRVLGTRFHVARVGERVDVEVDHGRVEVQFRDRVVTLGAKQTWTSDAPERVSLLDAPKPVIEDPVEEPKPAVVDPKPVKKVDPPVQKVDPKPPDKPPVTSVDPDQTKFEQLAILEKTNPQAALTGYMELAQRRGKWSPNALYAAARLAADRRDPLAATLLEGYLKRYPNGANASDARALLARINRNP